MTKQCGDGRGPEAGEDSATSRGQNSQISTAPKIHDSRPAGGRGAIRNPPGTFGQGQRFRPAVCAMPLPMAESARGTAVPATPVCQMAFRLLVWRPISQARATAGAAAR